MVGGDRYRNDEEIKKKDVDSIKRQFNVIMLNVTYSTEHMITFGKSSRRVE